jgi:hypothetical protein
LLGPAGTQCARRKAGRRLTSKRSVLLKQEGGHTHGQGQKKASPDPGRWPLPPRAPRRRPPYSRRSRGCSRAAPHCRPLLPLLLGYRGERESLIDRREYLYWLFRRRLPHSSLSAAQDCDRCQADRASRVDQTVRSPSQDRACAIQPVTTDPMERQHGSQTSPSFHSSARCPAGSSINSPYDGSPASPPPALQHR